MLQRVTSKLAVNHSPAFVSQLHFRNFCTPATIDEDEAYKRRLPQKELTQQQIAGLFSHIHARKQDKVTARKPAYPYDSILSIETPSLVVRMQSMQDNMLALNEKIDASSPRFSLRPLTAVHKCSDIVQLQYRLHNNDEDDVARMNGICCLTVNEAECLVTSHTNFLANRQDWKIRDILLRNVCIDINKMWRFIHLFDSTVRDMRLSTCLDDIFQLHLWNFTVEEFKKTNQNLLNRHSSATADNMVHDSKALRLGLMVMLKSSNGQRVGLNITETEQMESLMQILSTIQGEYPNNVYLRGFYVDDDDVTTKEWLLDRQNQQDKLQLSEAQFDELFIGNLTERYDGEYVFADGALCLVSTILNTYEDGDKFVHLLDCGYNNYSRVPMQMARYHRPRHLLDSDSALSPIVEQKELNETYQYEIINDAQHAHHTFLVCDKEFDVQGRVELLIPQDGMNSTVNLYNHCAVLNEEKQKVDGIWTIDARGAGN